MINFLTVKFATLGHIPPRRSYVNIELGRWQNKFLADLTDNLPLTGSCFRFLSFNYLLNHDRYFNFNCTIASFFFFFSRALADSSFKISLVHIKQIKNWLLVLN